jgi:hypothetical protein
MLLQLDWLIKLLGCRVRTLQQCHSLGCEDCGLFFTTAHLLLVQSKGLWHTQSCGPRANQAGVVRLGKE